MEPGNPGPQGASGKTLKRLCSSAGERAPSWSYRCRVVVKVGLGVSRRFRAGRGLGVSGRTWGRRGAHLVVLFKGSLHKLVAEVAELRAAAGGHRQPGGQEGQVCFTVPGTPLCHPHGIRLGTLDTHGGKR